MDMKKCARTDCERDFLQKNGMEKAVLEEWFNQKAPVRAAWDGKLSYRKNQIN